MKHFFRLLFISFGLLLLLGLNEKQSGDSIPDPLTSSALTFQEIIACTHPSTATEAALLLTTPAIRPLPAHYRETIIQKEQTISTGIRTRILSIRDRYMEFCPYIHEKNGQPIHLSAQRDDPPLA